MAKVELRRVSKVYAGPVSRRITVLDQVDLQVDDGELLVLLGPNGSGKTTLLRLIAGLESVTSGEICLGGEVVNHRPPQQRDVAMVFQNSVLYPHLTVEQNLSFGARNETRNERGVLGWIWSRLTNRAGANGTGQRSDAQDLADKVQADEGQVLEDRVRVTAQLLGIESMLNRLPRQLSGGERQRVALGRALVRQPAVFLLDEPLASADMKLRQELRWLFRRARQRVPGTMILVSHDHAEALALGERIAVLGDGKIQQIGAADEVFSAPRNRFVAEFMGQTGMSFVDGRWYRESEEFYFESEFGRLKLPRELSYLVEAGVERVCVGWRANAARVHAARVHAASQMPPSPILAAGWNGIVNWVELNEEGSNAFIALQPAASLQHQPLAGPETTVAARISPSESFKPGERVRVELDMRHTYWFDSQTGKNLAVRK